MSNLNKLEKLIDESKNKYKNDYKKIIDIFNENMINNDDINANTCELDKNIFYDDSNYKNFINIFFKTQFNKNYNIENILLMLTNLNKKNNT